MRRPSQVMIVGRDAELWLSALALHRALKPAGVKIQVVELPSGLAAHDFYSAAPSLSGLHRLLGIDALDLLMISGGIPVNGQRFTGWSAQTSFCGYDAKRAAIDDVDVLQFWVKLHLRGSSLPLSQLSTAAVASSLGRVGPDGQDPLEFGTVHRGLHLDARAYSKLLAETARQRGIETQQTDRADPIFEGDRIVGVQTGAGDLLRADLYVDASGDLAVLASQSPNDRWDSWHHWIPTDRISITSAPRLNPIPPFADIRATPSGWTGMFPLAQRTAIASAYSSKEMDDDAAFAAAKRTVGTTGLSPPIVRNLACGKRPAWTGNCIAIGQSAVALPPLDLMQLHFAHVGLSNLIAWFPADVDHMLEAQSYNDVIDRYSENVRDFHIARYRLNQRVGESLWDHVRHTPGPDQLDARLKLFAARGIVPTFDDETFDEAMWSNLLIGNGLIPRSYHPTVEKVGEEELSMKLQRLINVVEDRAREMPTIAAYFGQ